MLSLVGLLLLSRLVRLMFQAATPFAGQNVHRLELDGQAYSTNVNQSTIAE
jgi:hypothetical protein